MGPLDFDDPFNNSNENETNTWKAPRQLCQGKFKAKKGKSKKGSKILNNCENFEKTRDTITEKERRN